MAEDLISEGSKEYQTLFWVPILFQTAKNAESLIEEMLELIQDFHDQDTTNIRRQSMNGPSRQPKRRVQILGEAIDSQVTATRVDVVLKSDNTKYTLLSVLKKHFLFSQLRDFELEDVIDVMQAQYVSENEVIIQEGDAGDLFYILEEGECEISKGGEVLGNLESGTSFGDLALMYNCPRAATIKTVTECTFWTLDRVFFRQAMVTSSSNQNVQLASFLSKIQLFETIGVQKLNQLARSLTKQTYEEGEMIIRQGDVGDQFYVIYRGSVRVTQVDDSGTEKVLIELKEGDIFGERALIKKEPRKANVIANGAVECYYLESQDFYSMLGEFKEKFNKLNEFRIIRAMKLFEKLNDNRLKELISKLKFHSMFSGQRVVCNNDEIFLILDGKYASANNTNIEYRFDQNNVVGNAEQCADVIAGSLTLLTDEGMLASVTRDIFIDISQKSEDDDIRRMTAPSIGGKTTSMIDTGSSGGSMLENTNLEDSAEKEIILTSERRKATARARRQSLAKYMCESLNGLEFKQPLGKGTFGSVYLVRQNMTGKLMALKCLDKKALIESGQHHYVRREIIALQNFQHPFLAEYYGVILCPRKICLMLEFISGGELWTYLYNVLDESTRGQFGGMNIDDATLYASNVILALEHVHGLGYAYRDLKPENLLISSSGYLKIVDFGFAKQVPFVNKKTNQTSYRTFTLCGTPDYMSPELVLTQGHDKGADYWAYGVLLYELICGHTPFESSNQQRTFEKIVHSQKHLCFPQDFNPHCKSLIRRLLHPNAALRLGSLQNGINDIKDHAYFTMQNVDFDKVLSQEITMPYIPPVFDMTKPSNTTSNIEILDFEYEMNIVVEDEYNIYFQNLNNPELLEDTN